MKARSCNSCSKRHRESNSPVCRSCRHRFSKKKCPVDGCTAMICQTSLACTFHCARGPGRHHAITIRRCSECKSLLKKGDRQVCTRCRRIKILCACGCGRYRNKYGKNGNNHQYISGHNDSWKIYRDRIPPKECPVCNQKFVPRASRQRICSSECRNEWLRQNPPNEKKRVKIACTICKKDIWRCPSNIAKGSPACSAACRVKIVSIKLKGRISKPKRLAAARDMFKCRICGFDQVIEVHHIQPRKRNGGGGLDTLENLITLCPNHHTLADRGLIPASELRKIIAQCR